MIAFNFICNFFHIHFILNFTNINKNKINISKYLFLSNYSYKWSQEEYLTQILKYSEFFPKYNVKKISRINYKDNKKINIGFLGKDFNKNHAITFFIKDLIKKLDTKKFQVHIFSFLKNSQIDKELEINSVKIYHAATLNNQELINLIQEKKIEILFDIMDYCLTVRGTIGIESACFGIPTITAGSGRYDNLGFTIDSNTREEYLYKIKNIEKNNKLTTKQTELARRYAFGVFIGRPTHLESIKISYKKNKTADLKVDFAFDTLGELFKSNDLDSISRWIESGDEDYFNNLL